MSTLKRFFMCIGLLLCFSVQANNPKLPAIDISKSQKSEGVIELNSIERNHAAQWKLTDEEYARYKEIMSGPRPYFTPKLDRNPLLALALQARSNAERERYADQWVKIQYENNVRVLVWGLFVGEAWERNYPGVPRFTYGQKPTSQQFSVSHLVKGVDPFSSVARAEKKRVKVYVTLTGCDKCDHVLETQIETLKNDSIGGIDIFFVGEASKADIAKWSLSHGITPKQVNEDKTITLNLGRNYKGGVPNVQLY
ncbi:hypothetical protein [Vibrio rotiferianus]|uniref:hypothetical protein n=1 Tax=Vibrio rotiferianus TaxID=190895 RepID=UPI0006950C26|nr:hypothetical protein [Vibrio rotiferianus]